MKRMKIGHYLLVFAVLFCIFMGGYYAAKDTIALNPSFSSPEDLEKTCGQVCTEPQNMTWEQAHNACLKCMGLNEQRC